MKNSLPGFFNFCSKVAINVCKSKLNWDLLLTASVAQNRNPNHHLSSDLDLIPFDKIFLGSRTPLFLSHIRELLCTPIAFHQTLQLVNLSLEVFYFLFIFLKFCIEFFFQFINLLIASLIIELMQSFSGSFATT